MGWTTGPSLVVPTRDSVALVWGNILTLVGGTDAAGNTRHIRRKYVLNDTVWTAMKDAPYGIAANCGVENETMQYFSLMWDMNQKVTKENDSWADIANQSGRGEYCALAWDGGNKFLVTGGVNAASKVVKNANEFDITTGKWTVRTGLPVALYSHDSFYYGGNYYVVGGELAAGYSNKVYKMAAVGGTTWTQVTQIPAEYSAVGFQGCLIGSKYYLCGGSTNDFTFTGATNTVYSYDAATDTWKKENIILPTNRCYGCCVNLGGKLVLVGGMDETANPTPNVDIYTFETSEITVSVTTYSKTKISSKAGMTASTVLFTVDTTCAAWEARATTSGQTPAHGVGLLVGTGGALAAGVAGTFDVDASELTNGDGVYQITIYAKDSAGSWW